jgi:predicted metallo-beta-lactamase superfamily hydrolase
MSIELLDDAPGELVRKLAMTLHAVIVLTLFLTRFRNYCNIKFTKLKVNNHYLGLSVKSTAEYMIQKLGALTFNPFFCIMLH